MHLVNGFVDGFMSPVYVTGLCHRFIQMVYPNGLSKWFIQMVYVEKCGWVSGFDHE